MMKFYELVSSLNALENGMNYLEGKLYSQDTIMSDSEVNDTIEKIENLNNQYQEILNSDIQYSFPNSSTINNHINVSDGNEFLKEIKKLINANHY